MQPTDLRVLGGLALGGLLARDMAARVDFAAPAEPPGNEHFSAWFEKQLDWVLPKAADRKLSLIDWAADNREAIELAQGHNGRVFPFKRDGQMDTRRC